MQHQQRLVFPIASAALDFNVFSYAVNSFAPMRNMDVTEVLYSFNTLREFLYPRVRGRSTLVLPALAHSLPFGLPAEACSHGDIHRSCVRKVMTLQNAVTGIKLSLLFYKTGFWKLTAETGVLRGEEESFLGFKAWLLSLRSLRPEGLRAYGGGINNRFGRIGDQSESDSSAPG